MLGRLSMEWNDLFFILPPSYFGFFGMHEITAN